MKNACVVLGSLIVFACTAYGVDHAEWVKTTDRRSNPEIIRFMTEGTFAETLALAAALGSRLDPYVADIIASYLAVYRHGRHYETERVLSTLLAAVFPRNLDENDLAARLEANREAVDDLVAGCDGFESAELRSACIRLGSVAVAPGIGPLIAREGGRLAARLRENRGSADRGDTEEILVLMDAMERSGLKEFRRLLADFARFSADRRIVERAKALSGTLN